MSRAEVLEDRLREARDVCSALIEDKQITRTFDAVVELMVGAIRNGGKVLLCGNGGSAADAQHLAAELVGRFCLERQPYAALALADNVAALTAIGNDYAYSDVYSRAVRGLGRPGDVVIGLSTSGRSQNIVEALHAAADGGMATVAFVGVPGSPMEDAATHVFRVPAGSTARIQEGHMLLGHTIFELVERELCER